MTFPVSFRNLIMSRFSDVLGQLKIDTLDKPGNAARVVPAAQDNMNAKFAAMCLRLANFAIENSVLPEDVKKPVDTCTKMGMLGDLNQHSKLQTANVVGDDAIIRVGVGGVSAQLAEGVATESQMAGAIAEAMHTLAAQPAAVPPPLPSGPVFFLGVDGNPTGPFDLATLKSMAIQGKLRRETLVWRQGMPGWAAAETVVELTTVLANVPPALPS